MKASEALATYSKPSSKNNKNRVPKGALLASEHTAKSLSEAIMAEFLLHKARRVHIMKKIGIATFTYTISVTDDGTYALRKGDDVEAEGTHNMRTIITAMLDLWGVH